MQKKGTKRKATRDIVYVNKIPRFIGPQPRQQGRRALSGVEKKFIDTSIVNIANVTAGSVLNSLNLIARNTTDQTRIGNKITVKNINLHGFANNDDGGTAAFQGGNLRVILYVDKQCNGATAAVLDILTTATIDSFRNMDQVDRFDILRDKTFPVPIVAANALHTDQNYHAWKMNVKCNYPIHFNAGAGVITEVRSNNIGLLYITDIANVNAAAIGTARVKFTDD